MSDPMVHTVAVVGLGVIGGNMARRLLESGRPVIVSNRSQARAQSLVALGARLARTPAEAAAGSELTIVAVTDDAALLEVILGTDGVIGGAARGSLVVNVSTVHPATERQIARALGAREIGYLDAPVTGGAEAAAQGTLTLLCGGSEDDFARAQPTLATVGARILHMGPTGFGQLTKAINQVILAGSLAGVAEGMAFARASGMDLHRVIDALKDGAGASWVLSNRATFMARDDYPPVGRLALHLKDLNIALDAAAAAGIALRCATLVRDLEYALNESGRGDFDISALILAVESRATASTQP